MGIFFLKSEIPSINLPELSRKDDVAYRYLHEKTDGCGIP